eukprot:TRINITY_DN7309_c0_g1_i2.p1 TRINITY_DN7309_c0_g1~~TRINITY_DN7309_c0_g1_i2.p1  ORF type:complete len:318 (-),score=71.99 TRINITY_DN7309_c0_g1_i2:8-961(-)
MYDLDPIFAGKLKPNSAIPENMHVVVRTSQDHGNTEPVYNDQKPSTTQAPTIVEPTPNRNNSRSENDSISNRRRSTSNISIPSSGYTPQIPAVNPYPSSSRKRRHSIQYPRVDPRTDQYSNQFPSVPTSGYPPNPYEARNPPNLGPKLYPGSSYQVNPEFRANRYQPPNVSTPEYKFPNVPTNPRNQYPAPNKQYSNPANSTSIGYPDSRNFIDPRDKYANPYPNISGYPETYDNRYQPPNVSEQFHNAPIDPRNQYPSLNNQYSNNMGDPRYNYNDGNNPGGNQYAPNFNGGYHDPANQYYGGSYPNVNNGYNNTY